MEEQITIIPAQNVSTRYLIKVVSKSKEDKRTYYFLGLKNNNCFWKLTDKIEDAWIFESAEEAIEQKKDISFAYRHRFDFMINEC